MIDLGEIHFTIRADNKTIRKARAIREYAKALADLADTLEKELADSLHEGGDDRGENGG